MSKADPTAAIRVARDRDRKRKAGLVRVSVWVPAAGRDQLIELARHLRKEHNNT